MPLFMVRWSNGDLSFVQAKDKDDANVLLDEVGDAYRLSIRQIKDVDEFMVHLRLTDDGNLELESLGEVFDQAVMEWAYPIMNATCEDGTYSKKAVEAERDRVKPPEPEEDTTTNVDPELIRNMHPEIQKQS